MKLTTTTIALLMVAASVGLGACAHAPTEATKTTQNAQDYWPLQIGNRWTYRVSYQGAVQENSVEIISQDADGFYVDSQGGRIKHHPAGIFDGERFLLRDPIQLGANWLAVPTVSSLERYEIIAAGFTATVPAGVFEPCVRVQAKNQVSENEALVAEWTYAAGVGLIQFTSRYEAAGKDPIPQTDMQLIAFKGATHP